jgi:hypothetical protein
MLEIPALLYESESWTVKARDIYQIKLTETEYLRRVTGSSGLDHIKNENTISTK